MVNTITVVGSINVDSILHIQTLPQPGETIAMNGFSKAAGGKGANQAIAAVRSGAKTTFIGRIGDDDNGQFMLKQLADNQINVDAVRESHTQTGQAYILLQATGQNSIIVQAGANGLVSPDDIKASHRVIDESDFIVAQVETPTDAAIEAFTYAHQVGVKTIFNPAPVQTSLPKDLIAATDLIVPNETEAEAISGIPVIDKASMHANAEYFHQLGIEAVIITLGSMGSFVSTSTGEQLVSAFTVKAVDTTAAGDTFIGALAAELAPDFSNLIPAVQYASRASSLTVQTLGAFPSIPTRAAIIAAQEEDKA
ncbi:ribokinase [Lacticaseibacillus sp. N501-2]|uniref:ribokinase n=1 Tax=Lacticaseibacillus salsurae TaxID=3367729 RepID=UPI0038B41721